MTIAFTFPGQGSQTVGMGRDLADTYAEARAIFEEVDDALGEKLSAVIRDGPQDDLTLTANAQPALMAVSIAALRVLEARGFTLADRVAYVAGHSLGEYSALCAAGTFSLADTARLLRIRGDAMQSAVAPGDGGMAALIGLDRLDVEAVCDEAGKHGVCEIANDNGGGQIVVSGARTAVENATVLAGKKGAKRALMLPVSAPFHSSLMAPAAARMREALAEVAMQPPACPVVANVRADAISDPDAIARCLVEQVTGQVRWRETVVWLASQGVGTLYEIGAGKVLSGLVRRIDRSVEAISVNTPDDVEKALPILLT